MKQRIFISSVQKEFAEERQALKTYVQGDALLSRFFDVFLFEDIPARDRRTAGLPEPEFTLTDGFVITLRRKPGRAFEAVGGEVTGEVERLVLVLQREMKRTEIQGVLGLRHEDYFREAYLVPAIEAGYVEMTIPDKPKSSKQKYRLTAKGKTLLATLAQKGGQV